MGNWTYDGAVIVRGLWELQTIYPELELESFLHQHLNFFLVSKNLLGLW